MVAGEAKAARDEAEAAVAAGGRRSLLSGFLNFHLGFESRRNAILCNGLGPPTAPAHQSLLPPITVYRAAARWAHDRALLLLKTNLASLLTSTPVRLCLAREP